jgi:VWFA-related protein
MRRRRIPGIAAAAALAATLQAQQPAQPPSVFTSGVELLAIDASVTVRDGRPIASLQADQFDVLVDGRPRRVVSAQYLASGAARRSGADDEMILEATFSSNQQASAASSARLVVLLVDQASFSATGKQAAVEAARRVLDRLAPGDRVALATFPGPGPRVPLTTNHDRVRRALDAIVGLAEPWPVADPYFSMSETLGLARGDVGTRAAVLERECSGLGRVLTSDNCAERMMAQVPQAIGTIQQRVLMAVFGLQRVIDSLASVDGPKVGILISTGLPAGERVGDLDTDRQTRELARSAAAARLSLFTLHVDNQFLERFTVEQARQSATNAYRDSYLLAAGLQSLANESGGVYQKLAGDTPAPFDRVANELSAAYLLGVEPLPTDRDGKPHRIQVRVRVPNATVRSRAQFLVPPATLGGVSDEQRLAQAVSGAQMVTGLPLRLSHVSLKEPDGRVRVVLSVAIGRGVSQPETVKFGYVLFNAAGRVTGQAIEARQLQPVGPGEDAAFTFMEAMTVVPGDYVVKFAALDARGRLGSVFHNIDARLPASDGVSTSDVLLIDPSRRTGAGELLPIADGRVLGLSLGAYLEIYAEASRSQPEVSMEVAERPTATSLVTSSLPVTVKETGRRWAAEGILDLSLVPPGSYVVSLVVADGERRLAAVSRPIRLEPRAGATALNVTVGPRAGFAASATGLLVRGFSRVDALSTDALGFFLARLNAADPSASKGATGEAASAITSGRITDAMAALTQAGADELGATFLRGLALFAAGDLEPAAQQFRAALRISNEFMPAVFYLGACYAAGGRDREAAGAWQTSLVTESEARIIFDVLGDALLRLQDGDQAASILGEAHERWPDDDLFLPRLAAAQVLQKKRAEALTTIAPYIERHPGDVNALVMALRVLYESHQAGKAAISQAEDRARAAKYAELYKAAGGAEQALIDRWAAFIGRSGAK